MQRLDDRQRAVVMLVAALALAALLRVPWLGAAPTPAGDEGNWALLGLRLHEGVAARLPPDAAFVTTALGHLIAWSFTLFGVSWASARAVLVVGLLAAMVATAIYGAALAWRRASVVVALVLALHPWSVLWSRTVSVPYALSLALAVVGPLAYLDAMRTKSPWRMLVAAQLLGVALHFSPLAAIPIAACALHSFVSERPRRWNLLAAATGALHVLPVAVGVVAALGVGRQRSPEAAAPLPSRALSSLRMLLGDIAGTSTATHFVGASLTAQRAGLVLATLLTLYVAWSARRRAHPLTRFAVLYGVVAFVGVPLMLWPGRAWDMPVIDADRYGFALVAPLALALGGLAEQRTRHASVVVTAALLWFASVSAFVAWRLVVHGGVGGDRGLFVAQGGGAYRGWRVSRERRALPDLLRDAVLRDAGAAPVVLGYDDYAFHAVRFSIAAARVGPRLRHALGDLRLAPGTRAYFVLWSDGAFATDYEPSGIAAQNRTLRARVLREEAPRRVRSFVTVDGAPLCELWTATIRP